MLEKKTARAGLGLALLSSAAFGTSGTFARALIDAGWSPGAAVTVRISIAALILAIPAYLSLRGRWHVLRRNLGMIAVYGLVAIAGCQVFYFNAVQHLSVGVALLLEYMGIILVVGWLWFRSGRAPRRLTIAGSAASVVGLVLVLDLIGDAQIDLVGVLWGLGAAVGLAVFFVLSAKSDSELPPLAMASGGMTIGAVTLIVLGAVGVLPMQANTDDVVAGGSAGELAGTGSRSVGRRRGVRLRGRDLRGPQAGFEVGVLRRAHRDPLRGAVRLAVPWTVADRHPTPGWPADRRGRRACPDRRTAGAWQRSRFPAR